MCNVAQALEEKGRKQVRTELIQKNIRKGYSKEEIMDFMDCAEEEYRKAEVTMVANNALKDLYNTINKMTTSEFSELITYAQTTEEREFYFAVFDAVLQQKQKNVIQAKKY